ncbi:MAG: hypothetical protein M9894_30365 [Planctomycetes bacterium]|nr:hypothetical protein [Planctomycetota bacterium]
MRASLASAVRRLRPLLWRGRRVLALLAVAAVGAGAAGIALARGALPDPRAWARARGVSSLEDVARVASTVHARVERVFLPGALTPLHAGLPAAARCDACHDLAAPVPDRKCLACHPGLESRPTASAPAPPPGAPAHAGFVGACRACHGDHKQALIDLDPVAWNHARARFPLDGAHARARCEACHERPARDLPGVTRWQFQDLAWGRCTDCHEDPHGRAFEPTGCAECHRTGGWTGDEVRFDHATSAYPLRGAHGGVACAACHAKGSDGAPAAALGRAVLRGLEAKDCASCHTDPHRGSLAPRRCDACHDPGAKAWSGEALVFDHARDAGFALDATHAPLDCASCHVTGKVFAPLPTDCAGCHVAEAAALRGALPGQPPAPPDPHAGLVDCAACHRPEDRRPPAATFADRCAGCHTARYGELFVAREARVAGLEARARAASAALPAADREAALAPGAALRRQRHHAYTPAARALEAWVRGLETQGGGR